MLCAWPWVCTRPRTWGPRFTAMRVEEIVGLSVDDSACSLEVADPAGSDVLTGHTKRACRFLVFDCVRHDTKY